MQIAIEDIKIRRRVRVNLDNVEELMESIRHYGLLNPITVNAKYELIAGRRRLEAAKRLGWRSISATVLDDTDRISELELEIEENTQRNDFTEAELLAAYTRLEKMRNPNVFVRIWRAIVAFFKSLFSPKI